MAERGVLLLGSDEAMAKKLRAVAPRAGLVAEVRPADETALRADFAAPVVLILVDGNGGPAVPAIIAQAKADPRLREVPMVTFVGEVREEAVRACRAAGAERILVRDQLEMDLMFILRAV